MSRPRMGPTSRSARRETAGPMGQRETVAAPVHLFFGDRPPQAIDDCGRIVVDLDRAVEVFSPQRQSGVPGQHRIAGRDVDLGVVEQ